MTTAVPPNGASPVEGTARRHGPAPSRGALGGIVKLAKSSHVRLFFASVSTGLFLAIVTGPSGSGTAPTSGITGSLSAPRVYYFLALGIALFAVRTGWAVGGTRISGATRVATAKVTERLRHPALRVLLELGLIGFGFAYVSWVSPHDPWRGGLCVQLGVVLLCVELVRAVTVRTARWVGLAIAEALVGLYGLLAWLDGPVSRYLDRVEIVPHNPVLGRLLMSLAIVLLAVEALVLGGSAVRRRAGDRRGRSILAAGGVALVVYGWLTWTSWSQWNPATPKSFAHWLGHLHVLTHSPTAGLACMAGGAALLLLAVGWVGADVARREVHAADDTSGGFSVRERATPFGRPAVIAAVMLLALEWPLHMGTASQSNIDTQIMPFVLLALGLNVVIGFAGLLDLGYVAFYAIGAYTTAYFVGALPVHPPFQLDVFWSIPFAILAAMLAGVLLGTPTLRLRGDYLAIVTLGFGGIIELCANNLDGLTGGPAGAPGTIPGFSFRLLTPILRGSQEWNAITYIPFYYVILAAVVLSFVAFHFLNHSKVGRSWAAIREDEVAASSLGVNPLKYKVLAFAIGASTGGFAGVFLVSQNGTLFPTTFTIYFSILVVVCVVFGGMGSLSGAVVGAIVIAGLPAYLEQEQYSWFNPEDLYLYLGVILVLMMIFRPQGIIPSRRRRRELELVRSGGGPHDDVVNATGDTSGDGFFLGEVGYVGPEDR